MKLFIARDKIGSLNLYDEEPIKGREYFYSYGDAIALDNHLFPEITFEISPQEVEIKLVK